MLICPPSDPIFRVMALDPGTDTLGIAILDVNMNLGTVNVISAITHSGAKLGRRYTTITESHGERASRIYAHEQNIYHQLTWWRPHAIISESPYMGRFPQAFAALVECMGAIQRAVMRYNPAMILETVDPTTAKKCVGVTHRKSTKDDVRVGVMSMSNIIFPDKSIIDNLDEHSTDAIAVGYYKCIALLEQYRQ